MTAEEERDEAIARVEMGAQPWGAVALEVVRDLARRQTTITSEDVWQELDALGIPRPAEGRAMGAVMQRALREGLITPFGFTNGTNPRHHADVMRVYRTAA